MQDAVSEWLAAARHRFLVGYARSVIDSVGPAGAEFARIAESALRIITCKYRRTAPISAITVRSIHLPARTARPPLACKVEAAVLQTAAIRDLNCEYAADG